MLLFGVCLQPAKPVACTEGSTTTTNHKMCRIPFSVPDVDGIARLMTTSPHNQNGNAIWQLQQQPERPRLSMLRLVVRLTVTATMNVTIVKHRPSIAVKLMMELL